VATVALVLVALGAGHLSVSAEEVRDRLTEALYAAEGGADFLSKVLEGEVAVAPLASRRRSVLPCIV